MSFERALKHVLRRESWKWWLESLVSVSWFIGFLAVVYTMWNGATWYVAFGSFLGWCCLSSFGAVVLTEWAWTPCDEIEFTDDEKLEVLLDELIKVAKVAPENAIRIATLYGLDLEEALLRESLKQANSSTTEGHRGLKSILSDLWNGTRRG